VKHYRLYRYEGAPAEMEVEAEGEWVRFEDVASAPELKAEVENLRRLLQWTHESLKDCGFDGTADMMQEIKQALARKDGPA
jgi:hypothetical protein